MSSFLKRQVLLCFIYSTLFFVSCTKNETADNCFGELVVDPDFKLCDTVATPCAVLVKGDFTLTSKSKSFLEAMCGEVGKKINFTNATGKTISFSIEQKFFLKINADYETTVPCTKNKQLTQLYCTTPQWMGLNLKAQDIDLDLTISLITRPDNSTQLSGKVGDHLTILRMDPSGFGFIEEMDIIVDQRSLPYDKTDEQEFYSSIELNTSTYKNVLSIDLALLGNAGFKYYINEQFGLLAFEDEDQELWVRKPN